MTVTAAGHFVPAGGAMSAGGAVTAGSAMAARGAMAAGDTMTAAALGIFGGFQIANFDVFLVRHINGSFLD